MNWDYQSFIDRIGTHETGQQERDHLKGILLAICEKAFKEPAPKAEKEKETPKPDKKGKRK